MSVSFVKEKIMQGGLSTNLKSTIDQMDQLLMHIEVNLMKVGGGNKAAAQRVRTASIFFEKVAKQFRKLSMNDVKVNNLGTKTKIKKLKCKELKKRIDKRINKTIAKNIHK